MSETKTAYPLCWPAGWPATEKTKRERAKFMTTLPAALKKLQKETELLGGNGLLLSSNYTLGMENPAEPGVVAYFKYEGVDVAIPCDRWLRIEWNVHAIALTIEAMRGMERWGAKHMIKAMFSGFKLLGAPSGKHWTSFFGPSTGATLDTIKAAYRELSFKVHPDRGGSDQAQAELNAAYQQALRDFHG